MTSTGTGNTGAGREALDRVAGKAKQVAGAVTNNEVLAQEGHLQEDTADARRDARRLEERADQQRAEAELADRERELTTEQAHLQAQRDAESAEQEAEAQTQATHTRVSAEESQHEQQARARANAAEADAAEVERSGLADAARLQSRAASLAHAADHERAAAEALMDEAPTSTSTQEQ